MTATTRFSATARAWRRVRSNRANHRSRDGLMRFAPMRRVAWAIYRVQSVVRILFPFAFLALALWLALVLVGLTGGTTR